MYNTIKRTIDRIATSFGITDKTEVKEFTETAQEYAVSTIQHTRPAPISYLAGVFVNADQNVSVFEPSAGNGLLLTIFVNPENVIVIKLMH